MDNTNTKENSSCRKKPAGNSSLTEGNIKLGLIRLAIPLLLGDILQQFYNTVDSVIIGRYVGESAFAAVGIAGTLMNLFIFVISGCCVGMTVLFAQFYGSGDMKKFRREFFIALSCGGIFTIAISVLGILLLPFILRLIQTPEEAFGYSASYLRVIFAGLIATFLYNMLSAVLRAIGNTKASLYFLFIAVLTNVVLDLLFVAVFGMEMFGAALATVLSQFVSALLCFIYLMKKNPSLIFRREDMRFDSALLRSTFSYSSVSALQQSSLHIGKILIQGCVNALGINAVSAYTATTRIEGYVNSLGSSGTQAQSIFTAQNYGAKNYGRVKKGALDGCFMYVILWIIIGPLMALSSGPVIRLMINGVNEETLREGMSYLYTLAPFYGFDYIGCIMSGYFRGIGKINLAFWLTFGQVTIRVIFSYLLVSGMSLAGVALATGIGWTFAVIFVTVNYIRTKKELEQTEQC